jgi:thioredoxin-like negative regulator of GroEL
MITSPLKEIDGAMRGQVKVVKLNFNPGTAAKYDIMRIPTVDVVQERRACPRSDR